MKVTVLNKQKTYKVELETLEVVDLVYTQSTDWYFDKLFLNRNVKIQVEVFRRIVTPEEDPEYWL